MVDKLASEDVILSAPLSFHGSAHRIWRGCKNAMGSTPAWISATLAVVFIVVAWTFVLAWYLFFGLFLVPYRLIRRGSRKKRRDDLRHRELLERIGK